MFDDLYPSGEVVRAYLASDDLTTAAAVTFLNLQGATRTVATGERVVLTDIVVNNGGTASIVTIFQDSDGDGTVDAGEALYRVSLAANGTASANLSVPLPSARKVATAANGLIKAVASAASAGSTVILVGVVIPR